MIITEICKSISRYRFIRNHFNILFSDFAKGCWTVTYKK